jgi:hypothetical protein
MLMFENGSFIACKRVILACTIVVIRISLIVLLLTCQPAVAGQRVLLIRGLMDYLPGISPMRSLQARLTSEGYEVTIITHLTDGFYKNAYWDAVIGHSQGAIDALRDAPELARYNPQLTIVTIDPPQTSTLFRCVPGARYLNLHTGEFGLGGGSLSCPQAQNVAMGGLHITLPMRTDAQDRIIDYLHQDEVVDTELAYAPAPTIESTPLPPLSGDASSQQSSVTFGRDRDCISIPQGDAICMRKLP